VNQAWRSPNINVDIDIDIITQISFATERLIGPKWYRRQLVIMRYAELFKESIEVLLSSLEENFVSKSEPLLTQKSFVLVAYYSQRGLEMYN